MNAEQLKQALRRGDFDQALRTLYKDTPAAQARQLARYLDAVDGFVHHFGDQAQLRLFSTPGRTEVGGNHTDHNGGQVLAASVDLDVLAIAAATDQPLIRVYSEGYGLTTVGLDELKPVEREYYTTKSLIAGVAAAYRDRGFAIGGFDAYITSDVLPGSGLSSSAAFEVGIALIFDRLYNSGRVDAVTNAIVAQYAENTFFGKPCGLMDQTACSVGGFVNIDFFSFDQPKIDQVAFNFSGAGYTLCVVDTGGDHANLNEDYAALEHEMKAVARELGADVLVRTSKQAVLDNLPALRTKLSDRALLRAIHFFDDHEHVKQLVRALRANDFGAFNQIIIRSGHSSFMHCQNIYANSQWEHQGLSIALMLSAELLRGCGSWRVHGGGFAGTIQAFVPNDTLAAYREAMCHVFGDGSFYELMIRPVGATELT